jgi:hypothetical protein
MNKEMYFYWKQQIIYALNNILMSSIKSENAPMAAYQHFATGIEILYNLVPEYTHKDDECGYLLKELLTNQDILHGKITCDQGLKIMDDLDIYNVNKEI